VDFAWVSIQAGGGAPGFGAFGGGLTGRPGQADAAGLAAATTNVANATVRVDRIRGIVSWSTRAGGLVAVQVHASGGSASYLARLRVS